MNKSERLNDMIRYLSGKNSFRLRDLMERYSISRSSALRDVRALEELGLPIFTRVGRGGSYGILPNHLLTPILFTVDEMYALYVAMRTLDSYQTTPFHLDVVHLREKFEECAPLHRTSLHRIADILRLDVTKHANESACLRDILQFAVKEQPCVIYYQKKELRRYTVQFFEIRAAYGQWYGTAHDFEMEQARVFRCDRITAVEECMDVAGMPLSSFARPSEELYRRADALSFVVEITAKGRDFFYKEHYPSMRLVEENGRYYIHGFYNVGEEEFIADYFIHYGDEVQTVESMALREVIRTRLRTLTMHYKEMA